MNFWKRKSAGPDQAVVDQLQRDLDQIERKTKMVRNYRRMEPRVIEDEQGGMRFKFILYHFESKAWFGQGYKDYALDQCADAISPDETVFDFGCNSGYHTTWMALKAPRGHVYAFDPYPWNAAATRAQAALNGCSNVTVYQVGVGNADRDIEVATTSAKTFNPDRGSRNLTIAVKSVDKYAHHKPSFLKIDIEGAEHELASTSLLSWPSVRAGYVEMHPEFISAGGADPATFLNRALEEKMSVRLGQRQGPEMTAPVKEVAPTAYFFERAG